MTLYRVALCLWFVSPSVVEQCICYRLEARDMVSEWFAYSSNKNGAKLQMHNLEQFEHEVTTLYIIVINGHLVITNYSVSYCLSRF